MKKFVLITLWAVLSLGATSASAVPIFDIVVDFVPDGELRDGDENPGTPDTQTVAFSDRQKTLFGAAETFWESVLTGFRGLANSTFNLAAWMTDEDGVDGSLAFAAPNSFQTVTDGPDTFERADGGFMQYDVADFGPGGVQSEQLFLDSAVHEMGHALGFGTMFTDNNLIDVDGNYIGTNALIAFNGAYGAAVTSILMEENIGGHWNECWVNSLIDPNCDPETATGGSFNDTELMTPFAVDVPATISPATIGAFRDLGYVTIDPFTQDLVLPLAADIQATVPEPTTTSLFLAALFGLFASSRRRRSC